MSAADLRPSMPGGMTHPAVLDRRMKDALVMALTGLVPAAAALGITVAFPNLGILPVLGAIISVLAVVMLMVSTRLEITVLVVAFYLATLDGPVKLLFSLGELAPAVRDILLLAICVGVGMRVLVNRERVRLPPLSGWVLASTGIVLMEAFNPHTVSILKVIAGFRAQLEWVPFFFFGYLLMRSRLRFRQLFLFLGVVALANGAVSTYQTSLSPGQLASWGPGYRQRVMPEGTSANGTPLKSRVYSSEGEERVRPMGLGSDAGFGGGVGVLALPAALALLALWPARRRWIALILALGAIAAVATGLGRLQVIGAVIGALAFVGLAVIAGRRTRAFAAVSTLLVVAIPLGILFVAVVRSGTFKRYASIAPGQAASTVPTHKSNAWTKIPKVIAAAPFGVGLGTVGSVGGFGGKITDLVEGHTVSSETQYNYVTNELGAPGLILWVSLSLYIIALAVRVLPRVQDDEIAISLAAVFAPFVALFFMGFSGPWYSSAATGPYFWFAIGIAAYWLVGPGLKMYPRRKAASRVEPPALAAAVA